MPNKRMQGTKLAGAYIPDQKDEALAALAEKKGYSNKAEFIRALFEAALEEANSPQPTKAKKRARPNKE